MTSFIEISSFRWDDGSEGYEVYAWTTYRDSGQCFGTFAERWHAVRRARMISEEYGIHLPSAEVVPLFGGAA